MVDDIGQGATAGQDLGERVGDDDQAAPAQDDEDHWGSRRHAGRWRAWPGRTKRSCMPSTPWITFTESRVVPASICAWPMTAMTVVPGQRA
ncbi:hypothetical protein LUR56_38115 [Streptomyces sp. MT29]|nr:hypothetical protein [Streptomyces sp. MT29]